MKHGFALAGKKHPLYTCWLNMKKRCYRVNSKEYPYYGGRGIKVCERWVFSFENFRDDMLPTWQRGLTLERLDNDKDYAFENCKWATRAEQSANRRSWGSTGYKGVYKEGNKFKARIRIKGRLTYIGTFNTPEEANLAYQEYLES